MGNVNPLEIESMAPAEVKQAALDAVQTQGQLTSSAQAAAVGMPKANVLALLQATWEFNAERHHDQTEAERSSGATRRACHHQCARVSGDRQRPGRSGKNAALTALGPL
jgi:hypothetical protein